MAVFEVHIKYYSEYKKALKIFAKSEDEAEEKALEIISSWDSVSNDIEPEVTDIYEE